jgi:hypothetical protein
MNLNPIKANMTELDLGNGLQVLFSYRTPVAAYDWREGAGNGKHYRTSKKWSNTTTRHINNWLAGHVAEEKPQEFFDSLIAGVK